jgi:hypothetical protein
MPKQGDCTLTNLTAEPHSGNLSGALFAVVVNNLTDTEIPADAVTIKFSAAAADNLTQSSADESFYVAAVPAMGSHSPSAPMQLDPGHWVAAAVLTDSETYETIAESEAIDVHVAGQVHEAQAFDDSVKYEIGVHIESVEKLGQALYRVHYLLENKGSTTVPPGMLVRAMILENEDVAAWQDYRFEIACPPGPPDPKYLTLEGSSDFQEAFVYVIADAEGPSETSTSVYATSSGGAVYITR